MWMFVIGTQSGDDTIEARYSETERHIKVELVPWYHQVQNMLWYTEVLLNMIIGVTKTFMHWKVITQCVWFSWSWKNWLRWMFHCIDIKYNVHLPCGACKMRRYNKLASSYTRYQYIYRNCVLSQHIPNFSLNLW